MKIFNRWGEIVFTTNDASIGWDGIYLGEPSPKGVYPYVITYESLLPKDKDVVKMLNGSVTLIR
jgi:gliding motility-associated-like protein